MTRDQMLAELRTVLDDVTSGTNWSDTRLLGLLAEGQDRFCEDTGYFRDKTTHTLTLVAGTYIYNIPDRVIQILEVWDGRRKLRKLDTGEFFEDTLVAGDPAVWTTDQETGSIEFDRAPSTAEDGDTFVLSVWRYSQDALDDTDIEPEIPGRFQRACIEWAAYVALNDHDMDYQDPVKAADHLNMYNMYVNDGISAMRRYHNIETRVGADPAYRT